MNISLKSLIVPGVILLLALASWLSYSSYKGEKKRADDAEQSLSLANDTIKDMQIRQRDVAALDAKYTKDLDDAKKQLDDLQRCVRDGKCGLHVNARCPASGATSTGGMGDATGPRLTDSAERDYFTLRERIVTVTKQVGYLQDYIKEQCLK
ncbi:TPA: lysis protein [Enterobacter roggenkampii]|jgi:prophage endopeptidase|uniref:lysis protein n=1 Tax=Escherichia coli TaxID=562 RepID=UPI000DDAE63F|nr:lysis protein [Escherichia coli]EAA3992965.1 lysis protein [Salmonella enterica subsp. enterica serovar Ruiru]ECD5028351.1 lysis protein [Salmonella enterica subsp. enterica serovar Ruiru]EJE5239541.1 lysis protein [Escherichia coli]QSF77868.1 lysis protein [Escherichia coli]HAL6255105.1 lysis protein [Escherichia coli]